MITRIAALPLPPPIERRLDRAAHALLQPEGAPAVDFATPVGESALAAPDSVSWQVFKNPVTLFVGGVAAVILELAEPGVRAGVWEPSSFRTDPVRRLSRTGLAAMVTVYGARSRARTMIAQVNRMHRRVRGTTPEGSAYSAEDTDLLDWVQATAAYGFGQAYSRYVRPLGPAVLDRYYAEGQESSRLYGAVGAPGSAAEMDALFARMTPRLGPSPILFEFLDLMRRAPALPASLRPLQPMLVAAAAELTPIALRERLGFGSDEGLGPVRRMVVGQAARLADRLMLKSSPPVQACLRLGLPADYLYRSRSF